MSQSTIVKDACSRTVPEIDSAVLQEGGIVFYKDGKFRTVADTFSYYTDEESSSGSADVYDYIRFKNVALVWGHLGIDQFDAILEQYLRGNNGVMWRLKAPGALNRSEIVFTTTLLSGVFNTPTIEFNRYASSLKGIGLLRGGIYLQGVDSVESSITFTKADGSGSTHVIGYVSSVMVFTDASGYGFQFAASSSEKLGWWGATPVVRASAYTQTYTTTSRTHAAYTSDPESSAYTGIDNLQAGTPYAKLSDLNTLRIAYENLRVGVESAKAVLNQMLDDLQSYGLLG